MLINHHHDEDVYHAGAGDSSTTSNT